MGQLHPLVPAYQRRGPEAQCLRGVYGARELRADNCGEERRDQDAREDGRREPCCLEGTRPPGVRQRAWLTTRTFACSGLS
jgi:hypothetical protein